MGLNNFAITKYLCKLSILQNKKLEKHNFDSFSFANHYLMNKNSYRKSQKTFS